MFSGVIANSMPAVYRFFSESSFKPISSLKTSFTHLLRTNATKERLPDSNNTSVRGGSVRRESDANQAPHVSQEAMHEMQKLSRNGVVGRAHTSESRIHLTQEVSVKQEPKAVYMRAKNDAVDGRW